MGKRKDKKCKTKCCKEWININARDINKASQNDINGLVLSQSGNYRLCENVDWNNTSDTSYAITITGEHIVLDLGEHTLKQTNIHTSINFLIQVTGTAKAITIRNGYISQGSSGGIWVQPGASCITLDGLTLDHCSYSGPIQVEGSLPWGAAILIAGSATNYIRDVTVTNCKFCNIGIIGTPPVFFTGSISDSVLTVNPSAIATGSITPGSLQGGVLSGGTLTVTSVALGQLYVGQEIQGAGIPPGTTIIAYNNTGVLGGVGSYQVNFDVAVPPGTTITTGPLEPINVGFTLSGPGVTPGTTITGRNSLNSYTLSQPSTVTFANTTVAAASSGQILPAVGTPYTVNVVSTANFPPTGQAYLGTNLGMQLVNYTVSSPTTITATGGSGTLIVGNPFTVGVLSVSDPNALYIPKGNISALLAAATMNVVFENITVQDIFGELQMYAVQFLSGTYAGLISNIKVDGGLSFGLNKGIFGQNSQDFVIQDSTISNLTYYVNTTNTKTGGNGAEGIKANACTGVTMQRNNFSKCYVKTQVPGTTAAGGINACGITMNTANNYFIQDCVAQEMNNNGGLVLSNPTFTFGYNFGAAAGTNTEFLRCQTAYLNGFLGLVFGFGALNAAAAAGDVRYTNCTAEFINVGQVPGSGVQGTMAAGYMIQNVRQQVIGCTADRIVDQRTSVATTTIVLPTVPPTIPVPPTTFTVPVVSTAGFPPAGVITIPTSSGLQTVSYTGITANSFTGVSQIVPLSGTTLVAGAVTGPLPFAHGIYLFPNAANCTIKNNILTNSSTSAIWDATAVKNSFISENYAQTNGTGINGNYTNPGGSVNTAMTPIRNWQLNTLPAATPAVNLDNINAYV